MQNFTIDKDKFDEEQISKQMILKLINQHLAIAEQIKKKQSYYLAEHPILHRKKKLQNASNEKTVCNHAKDIADTSTGYFMSSPISYSTNEDKDKLNKLTEAFDIAGVDDVDHDNAHDMSVSGVAYEYVYVKEGETTPISRNLEPEHTFVVCDDTIEQNVLFGVYYYAYTDGITNLSKYKVTVATQNYIHEFTLENNGDLVGGTSVKTRRHFLGDVPMIQILNNKHGIGDFEQQISLIDAYNTLMSDRVNDKVQFVESLLVVYGALMGDDNKEVSEAVKILKENGLLELPLDAKAEYISRTFDENGMEVLRNAIKEDIYTFSHVPNLTDKNFVGNSSGVAMEYKLLGLEMITKTKERYYKKALKQRIKLYCNYLGLKAIAINPTSITATFSRGLPKNLLELSQMISNLKGTVSSKTLVSQLSFVEDADTEIEAVAKENEESIRRQQEAFKNLNNTPFNQEDDEDEDVSEDTPSNDKNTQLDFRKNN